MGVLWGVATTHLQTAMANFSDAESTLKRRYVHRWRTVATEIDPQLARELAMQPALRAIVGSTR